MLGIGGMEGSYGLGWINMVSVKHISVLVMYMQI